MSRQLLVPAADTQLYTVDAPGGAPPLLFLSGGFGTIRNWDRVIDRVGGRHRTVRFDARARGKSGTAADYSARSAVDDVGHVIEATGIERPIVVGTRAHSGATEEEMRTVRAAVVDATARNPRVSVFATTPYKHTQILAKAPGTVVAAIEDVIRRSS